MKLTATDRQLVKKIHATIYDSIGSAHFIAEFVKIVGETLESSLSTFAKHGPSWDVHAFAAFPNPTEQQLLSIPKISEFADDHPIVQYANTHKDRIVCKRLTGLVKIEEFRKTSLYREACGPAGLEYMLSASAFDEIGNTYTINLSHPSLDFTERHEKLLEEIYPLFLKAYRIHHLMGVHLDQLTSVLPITIREAEVLEWVTQSKTNTEIALILDISVKTVEKHLKNLLRKLRFSKRMDLIRYTSSETWISFPGIKETNMQSQKLSYKVG